MSFLGFVLLLVLILVVGVIGSIGAISDMKKTEREKTTLDNIDERTDLMAKQIEAIQNFCIEVQCKGGERNDDN